MRLHHASLLLLALASSGCVAVAAGATAGFLVSREVQADDVQSATVALDVDRVWKAAQDLLRAKSSKPVLVETFPRVVRGVVDGADVSIEVQAYDLDRTVILVDARKMYMPAGETAERVLNALLDRLS